MTLSAAYLGDANYETTPEDDRQIIKLLLGDASGRVNPSDFVVTPGTDLAISVSKGRAALKGLNTAAQGTYFVWSTLSEEIPCNVPDTLDRIDTLLLLIADSQYGTISAAQGPQWVWATGTPAAAPVALSDSAISSTYAQPGSWMRVADVRINAGATTIVWGNISQPGLVTLGKVHDNDKTETSRSVAGMTYATFTNAPSVQVVVPESGVVDIEHGGLLIPDDAVVGRAVYLSFVMSGANTRASVDTDGIYLANQTTSGTDVSRTVLSCSNRIEGLTPGLTTITLQARKAETTGSAAVKNTYLFAEPVR